MKTQTINGLHVTDYGGTGTPIIFVHAFPFHSGMWHYQVEHFKGNRRVITYDVRGLGNSRSENSQFMLEHYAEDFLMIIKELKLEKVIGCGLSMGGYILLRALEKDSSKFAGIILADTRATRDDNTGLINRAEAIKLIKSGNKKEFLDTFIKKIVCEESYGKKGIVNFIEDILYTNSEEGIMGSMIAVATRTDTLESLKNIDTKSLIIVGERDELTPLECAEKIHNNLKNSKLEVIKGSGHMSNIESPENFNKIVEIFLKEID